MAMSIEELEGAIRIAMDLNLDMVDMAKIAIRFGGATEREFVYALKRVVRQRKMIPGMDTRTEHR